MWRSVILLMVVTGIDFGLMGKKSLHIETYTYPSVVYEGQPFIYKESLATDRNQRIFGIGLESHPDFGSLISSEISPIDISDSADTIKNTHTLRSFLVMNKLPGLYEIEGSRYVIGILNNNSNIQGGNQFILEEDVTDYHLSARKTKIRIKSLPPSAPAEFTGLIGDYQIEYEVPEGRIEKGKEAQFIVKLHGIGFIDNNQLPSIHPLFPKELNVRNINVDPVVNIKEDQIISTAEYECTFMPEIEGQLILPEISMHIFNPVLGQYQKITTVSVKIDVNPQPQKHTISGLYVINCNETVMKEVDIL